MTKTLRGIICPLLTPYGDDGKIARDIWVSRAKQILDDGAHYLSPFGTTGEAPSHSVAERMEALEWLIEGGIPASKLLPGTGVVALPDTIALTKHAVEAGCAGTMLLPSFFFGAAGDDGQARYFSQVIEGVADNRLRMILYHIPQNTGTPVTPALTARMNADHPDTVIAYKDSAGDFANTQAVIDAAPNVSVFPGSESFLTHGLANGGTGCISATVNLNAKAIREVYDSGGDDAAMKAFRMVIQNAGLIPAMKAVLAVQSGDKRWLNLRAPLQNATLELGERVIAELDAL